RIAAVPSKVRGKYAEGEPAKFYGAVPAGFRVTSLDRGDAATAEPQRGEGPDISFRCYRGHSQIIRGRRYSAAARPSRSGNNSHSPSREAGQMPRSVTSAVTRRAGV